MNVTPVAHCPLCIPGMVSPTHDSRPGAMIFLDMDGVMITGRDENPLRKAITATRIKLFPEAGSNLLFNYQCTIAKGRHLNPIALKNLHTLIERVERAGLRALVVISSGWRNDATTQQLREEAFQGYEFSKHIAGKTPPDDCGKTPESVAGHDFSTPAKEKYELSLRRRAEQIKYWLLEHGFDPKTSNFVVIDDCDEGFSECFGNRFVQTGYLMLDEDLAQATEVLLPAHAATLSDDG